MTEIIIVLIAVTVIVTGMAVWDLWDNVSIMRSTRFFLESNCSPSRKEELRRQKDDVKRSTLMVLAGLVWPVTLVGAILYFIIDLIKGVREAYGHGDI